MNLRHLRIFVAVCQEGSITKVAKKLYISQPSVSLAIQELEKNYNSKLFDRISRRLYLTQLGTEVYTYAQRIISLYDEMNTNLKVHNCIRIGCGIAVGKLVMPRIIKEFCSINKDSDLRVTVNSSDIIESLLTNRELDLGIMEGTIHSSNLNHVFLHVNHVVAICHKDNPLTKKHYVTVEDLAKEKLLMRDKFSLVRTAVDTWFINHNLIVQPVWESLSALALINAVSEDLGISFLPYNHVVAFNNPNIAILNVKDLKIERSINIVYHKDKILTPLMQEFIKYCKESI